MPQLGETGTHNPSSCHWYHLLFLANALKKVTKGTAGCLGCMASTPTSKASCLASTPPEALHSMQELGDALSVWGLVH